MRDGAVLFTVLVLTSCSVGPSGDPLPTPGPIRDFSMNDSAVDMSMFDASGPSLMQACTDYAMAECTKTQMCSSAYLNTTFGDLSTCVARLQLTCNLTLAGSNTTSNDWEACGQATSAGTCDEFNILMSPTACHTKPGTLTSGAACSWSWQCQSTYCKRDYGIPCGTCANVQPVGGPCATDLDCGSTAKCNASKVCAAVVGSGATCDATHICDNAFTCKSNSCVARVPVDGACTMTTDCASGLTCVSNKCKAGTFVASGQPCGYLNGTDMPYTFCTKGYCWADTSGIGTCVGYVDDGAPCDLSMAQYCVYPAECSAGKCTIPDGKTCM